MPPQAIKSSSSSRQSSTGWGPLRVLKKENDIQLPSPSYDSHPDQKSSENLYQSPAIDRVGRPSTRLGSSISTSTSTSSLSSRSSAPSPQPLHPSAAAPRQSNAFKRLEKASLVSSSIFKSNTSSNQPSSQACSQASTSSSCQPSSSTSTGVSSLPRSQLLTQRPPGAKSQMAAALKGLGLQPPRSLNCESPKKQSETRPQFTDPHSSDPSSIQSSPRPRTKRKSDEDLPVPPRPAPNLPPSATPLKSTSNKSLSSKARPPRQSLAFNCLTRNALVSSSPFKVGTSKMSNTVASAQSDSGAPNLLTSSHSDEGENSSNESDLAPGTPPLNQSNKTSSIPSHSRLPSAANGVLKSHRLGGPRSFTPPQSPKFTRKDSQSINAEQGNAPPSALSTPGRRLERRKTVTWGGEDVLEFERDEEWRRTSGASSNETTDSPLLHSASPENLSDCSHDDIQAGSDDLTHNAGQQHLMCEPEGDQFWGRRRSQPSRLSSAEDRSTSPEGVHTLEANDSNLDENQYDQSTDSVVIHDIEVCPNVATDEYVGPSSFSSDTDPVDRMVDALLTSPDLAAHVTKSQLMQSWTIPEHEDQNSEDDTRDRDDECFKAGENIMSDEEADENQEISFNEEDTNTPKPSRFPYVKSEADKKIETETGFGNANFDMSVFDLAPMTVDNISNETAPFSPITLPNLASDLSVFNDSSILSTTLEPLINEINPIRVAKNSCDMPSNLDHPPMGCSSTPRASFSNEIPPPEPVLPCPPFEATSLSRLPSADGSVKISNVTSPRRPLPCPPPTTSPSTVNAHLLPSTSNTEAYSTFSALTAPACTLPEVAQSSPFVTSSSQLQSPVLSFTRPTIESSSPELSFDGANYSPGSARRRITREKIQERIRERDLCGKALDESSENGSPIKGLQLASHSASIHNADDNSHDDDIALDEKNSEDATELTDDKAENEVLKEIQARPPLCARAVVISETSQHPHGESMSADDSTLRQENMDAMSSGLDKLAKGFQSSEDVAKSSDSEDYESNSPKENLPGSKILPSKLVRVKGAGKRRRSFSTGGADIQETGTGVGAKAAVRSNPIKRHTLGSEKVSAPLNKAILKVIGDSDFQAPLDRALRNIFENGSRTYRIQEAEVVVASDDQTSTAGVAGDVASNRNWRKVRKVSDINEHEKQLKSFWAQNQNSSKIGKVFVKMSKLVFNRLPPLSQPVYFEVIIDNGIHTAKTATYKLEHEVKLGVEFELVRAKKLEFSLSFNVPLGDPRNSHLKPAQRMIKSTSVVSQPVLPSMSNSPKRGLAARLFGVHSKRNSKKEQMQQLAHPKIPQEENQERLPAPAHPLVALLDRDNNLAKATVNFEEYSEESLGQMKQVVVPCMSVPEDRVKAEMQMRKTYSGPVGQISIEFLSLPPMPKVPNAVLPNSSTECLKGLKIAEWWQEVWHEGVLSQMGADCQTWRRRTFKATGGSLFAYNDIINKISAEIRLTEVVSLEDCGTDNVAASDVSSNSLISDQGEILPPFTFRLIFKDGSEILFHADNHTEYRRWKNVLSQLIGKIQKLPAWAEILRLQLAAKQTKEIKCCEEKAPSQEKQTSVPVMKQASGSRQPGRKVGATRSRPMVVGRSKGSVASSKASRSTTSTSTSSKTSSRSTASRVPSSSRRS
ncbi:hypothetical protein BY996DRAFT_4575765 [Phakopsora pachyrhizi]|uniref:PH domain-containing protein n=1 Tax=Phakopsora pachyrhizi TaxID=170000 RepID=A0AAV0BKF3_PHAPC|nr:hypothetical protein BY996DRAFT_4575765 [Phakopsora pachyrhizi]CAH7686627.1 hypothetical protein PPACK8108_LOCUS21304 [Phakopsora pachyrhizi]